MSAGRILVVDDEPQLRRVMRSTLTALGYMIDDATNADAALEKLRKDKFDLLLLDVNMPGTLSGLELCRAVRSKSDVHIIMLTVRNAVEDKIKALDAGADDYVTKPFSINELLARIRAVLRRAPVAAELATPVVHLDTLEINLGTRRVILAGTETRLTPKEFDLLYYFLTNPNIALPHEKILQAVWGPDYGNEVEYLRVFVKQLRKKIEPDPAKPRYLVTEPWLGYRFAMPEQSPAPSPANAGK